MEGCGRSIHLWASYCLTKKNWNTTRVSGELARWADDIPRAGLTILTRRMVCMRYHEFSQWRLVYRLIPPGARCCETCFFSDPWLSVCQRRCLVCAFVIFCVSTVKDILHSSFRNHGWNQRSQQANHPVGFNYFWANSEASLNHDEPPAHVYI